MERIEAIRKHPLYISCYDRLQKQEEGRIFCNHTMEHFLDVARIGYIQNLEQHLGIAKDMIYAVALLHDLGKCIQYADGTPHELAGAEIASKILTELPESLAFSGEEKEQIMQAIQVHRNGSETGGTLGKLLYESDKRSRNCFACPGNSKCNWDEQKKNGGITV
ncbi:MAG: HD domain-containing protein [Lachnospiraceae bacterium]